MINENSESKPKVIVTCSEEESKELYDALGGNVEVITASENDTIPKDVNWDIALDSTDYFNEIGKYSMSSITGQRPACAGLKNKPKKNRAKLKAKNKAAKKAKRKNRR